MEAKRIGSKYTRICPQCDKTFWTDNKKVVYCSRACSQKVAKQSPESIKRYRQQPHIREKLTDYKRRYREEQKKKRLASDMSAYFTFMHSGRTNPTEIVTHRRKKGLRK